MDEQGNELQGVSRRFHTLRSLGLRSWSEVDARHLRMILTSCSSYFIGNPYDKWFRLLDRVVSGAGASYYDAVRGACHLDLIPYATKCKWTELTPPQRSFLLDVTGDTLGLLLRDSPVKLLILNGKTVVELFQNIGDVSLAYQEMPSWSLPRQAKRDVMGIAYIGRVHMVSGIPLGREVLVLGYNHNLQSSFGVTTEVIYKIRGWISQALKETTL